MSVSLVWITPNAEGTIAYCARVSNPSNQHNENIEKLLRYCAKHKHWSVFEMASMCVEIEHSRGIIDQIARHRSFSFQVFSTRYAESDELILTNPRAQDLKNRQSSHDTLDDSTKEWFRAKQLSLWADTYNTYHKAIDLGIAKESARDLLPFAVKSRMYMSGTIRSWIHYLQTRLDPSTQFEHRNVANEISRIFKIELPVIWNACVNTNESTYDKL